MNPTYPFYGEQTVCRIQKIAFPSASRPPARTGKPDEPLPISEDREICGSGRLRGRVALISGGDSGIGRAAAIAFAKEGADVAIAYLYEASDAADTARRIEQLGRRCLRIETDLRYRKNSFQAVEQTVQTFGRLDILVNNLAVQYPQRSLLDITEEQLYQTFQTNIFPYFFMSQAALPHLKKAPPSSIPPPLPLTRAIRS